jgi:hypothetical protein
MHAYRVILTGRLSEIIDPCESSQENPRRIVGWHFISLNFCVDIDVGQFLRRAGDVQSHPKSRKAKKWPQSVAWISSAAP